MERTTPVLLNVKAISFSEPLRDLRNMEVLWDGVRLPSTKLLQDNSDSQKYPVTASTSPQKTVSPAPPAGSLPRSGDARVAELPLRYVIPLPSSVFYGAPTTQQLTPPQTKDNLTSF